MVSVDSPALRRTARDLVSAVRTAIAQRWSPASRGDESMASDSPAPQQRPLRILLIEDDPIDAAWITELIHEKRPGTEIRRAVHLSQTSDHADRPRPQAGTSGEVGGEDRRTRVTCTNRRRDRLVRTVAGCSVTAGWTRQRPVRAHAGGLGLGHARDHRPRERASADQAGARDPWNTLESKIVRPE